MTIKSKTRVENRRREIIDACAKLYETMSFREITIKEIAEFTSFTRPSIYNYFQTKEEIFLAFFEREYEDWAEELDALAPSGEGDRAEEFADGLAASLSTRQMMLKLLSLNLNDMEMNSRMERLVEFKVAYGHSLRAVREALGRFFPETSEEERWAFLYAFAPFVCGIYPYTAVSDMQREAMERAQVDYRSFSIYKLARSMVMQLLCGMRKD